MDITTREHINILVGGFYAKVRKDDVLGPIFNGSIDHWPEHIEHLTDFWESNLFQIPKFSGNPPHKHRQVDKDSGHSITEFHFQKWLKLWGDTVDALYEGPKAEEAKTRARGIAQILFGIILKGRNAE